MKINITAYPSTHILNQQHEWECQHATTHPETVEVWHADGGEGSEAIDVCDACLSCYDRRTEEWCNE